MAVDVGHHEVLSGAPLIDKVRGVFNAETGSFLLIAKGTQGFSVYNKPVMLF